MKVVSGNNKKEETWTFFIGLVQSRNWQKILESQVSYRYTLIMLQHLNHELINTDSAGRLNHALVVYGDSDAAIEEVVRAVWFSLNGSR